MSKAKKMQTQKSDVLTVYYDGDCPVCRMEVNYYRRVDKFGRIEWLDITTLQDIEIPQNKDRAQLLGVFHALRNDGQWATGVDAFAAIWNELAGFNRLAWVFRTPVLRQIAQAFYRTFLVWQRRNRARRRMRSKESHVTS